MAALIIILFLAGLVVVGFAVAFYARLWSTLGMHRQAMHALHQRIQHDRLAALREQPGQAQPANPDTTDWNSRSAQDQRHSPHTRWNTRGSSE